MSAGTADVVSVKNLGEAGSTIPDCAGGATAMDSGRALQIERASYRVPVLVLEGVVPPLRPLARIVRLWPLGLLQCLLELVRRDHAHVLDAFHSPGQGAQAWRVYAVIIGHENQRHQERRL